MRGRVSESERERERERERVRERVNSRIHIQSWTEIHSLQQVKRLHECYEVFMGVTVLLTDVQYIGIFSV